MSTENINAQQELNNDELYNESTRRPWYHLIRGRSTCTANAYDIQHASKTKNKDPLNRKDIAHALHNRNLLCQTKYKFHRTQNISQYNSIHLWSWKLFAPTP